MMILAEESLVREFCAAKDLGTSSSADLMGWSGTAWYVAMVGLATSIFHVDGSDRSFSPFISITAWWSFELAVFSSPVSSEVSHMSCWDRVR